jgi:2-dehydropantoate 2-reductase
MVGIVGHGVYSTAQFSLVHAGIAFTSIGFSQSTSNHDNTISTMPELLRTSPPLVTTIYPSDNMLSIQLQKLTINAVFNPLTVVFDCINGEIFTTARLPLIRALVAELSNVTQALLSHQPQFLPNFSQDALLDTLDDYAPKIAKNISSMRQDVLAGRPTEIDYINGYVVKKAHEFGIPCPCNEQLVRMVKENERLADKDIDRLFGINNHIP